MFLLIGEGGVKDCSHICRGLEACLQLHTGDPGVVHLVDAAWIAHVLHVRAHGQPIGHVYAVIEFDVVFAVLHWNVLGVVVVTDARAVIDQAVALGDVVIDLEAGDAHAEVILGPRIKRAFVDCADILKAFDTARGLVVHSQARKDAKTA